MIRTIMESLIQIEFPEALEPIQCSHILPRAATYRMNYAHCNHWEHPSFWVVEQYYQTKDIFLYLGEVKTTIDLPITLHCKASNLYWVYQLEDEYLLLVNHEKRKAQLKTKEKSYRAVYVPLGDHSSYFEKDGHYVIFYFVVDKDLLLRFQDTSLRFIKDLLDRLKKDHAEFAFSIRLPIDSRIMLYMRRLFGLGRLDDLALDEHIHPTILRLLALARSQNRQEKTAGGKPLPKVEQIRQQVLENIQSGHSFTIRELAESFDLSIDYLRQIHKQFFHESLQRFITRSRLEEAYRQIAENGKPPTEVAQGLSFYDGAAFTRAFKKEFDITPGILYQQYHKK